MGQRARAELAIAYLALVWGTTFVLIKNALADISPILFVAVRFVAAAAFLALVIAPKLRRVREWPPVFAIGTAAGALLCAGYAFQTAGLRYTTPSNSAFVTGLYIVLVPLLGAAVHMRVPRAAEWCGVAAAAAGLTLMTVDFAKFQLNFGDFLTIWCAIAFAGHILVLARYADRVDPAVLGFFQIAAAGVMASLLFPAVEQPRLVWSRPVVWALLITTIPATSLAFTLQSWAQRHTTATRAALIFSLEPVFAMVTSYALLIERPSGRAIGGAALILAGIVLVEVWKPGEIQSHQMELPGRAEPPVYNEGIGGGPTE